MIDEVRKELQRIEAKGGALKAVEAGYQQREIHKAAFAHQRSLETGERSIVGVNVHTMDESTSPPVQTIDADLARAQEARLKSVRDGRDEHRLNDALAAVEQAAIGEANLMPYVLDAVRAEATVGEICGVLRKVFGEYTPPSGF